MKTAELIEEAELFLEWSEFGIGGETVRKLIDRLKRYEEALKKLRDGPGVSLAGWRRTWANKIARKALEEE